MTKIKFDPSHMKFMALFENITKTSPKDCIIEEKNIIFIVNPGNVGKAIGKKGVNVKKLEQKLSKKIKIVEFNDDITIFTQNMIYPLKNLEINMEGNEIIITGQDVKTKGLLIGRDSQNLQKLQNRLKRYFKFEKIKVN